MKIKPGMEREYAKYVEVNSKDSYSKEVVDYGERWMNLMEDAMEKPPQEKYGEGVEEVTSHEADTSGITGFMNGAAAAAISHFWIHGDQFQRWYNKKCWGTGDEKGVINPAIISVGGD